MKKIVLLLLPLLGAYLNLSGQVDLEKGLVAFYPFNGSAVDESSNRHHAITVDQPQLIEGCDVSPTGKFGTAYYFDGIDDYIEIAHADDLSFSNDQEFAISTWVKIPAEQENTNGVVNDILSKWSAHNDDGYSYALRYYNQTSSWNGQVGFLRFESRTHGCSAIPWLFSVSKINDDTWHNVIMQRTADDLLQLYIDGVLEGSMFDPTLCDVRNTHNITIGLRTTLVQPAAIRRPFTGGIDNIRFYNRALTADEILAINQKLDINTSTQDIEKSLADRIRVFPNPTFNGQLTVDLDGLQVADLRLIDLQGRLVRILQPNETVVVDGLATGIYLLRVEVAGAAPSYQKVVVGGNIK